MKYCLLVFLLFSLNHLSSTSVDEILKNHEAFLGGKSKIETIRTMVIKGRIKQGDAEGKFTTWYVAPDKLRSEINIMGLNLGSLYIGKNYYKIEKSVLTKLQGSDLAKAITEMTLTNYSYLRPNENGIKTELGKSEKIDNKDAFPIKMIIKDGKEIVLYFTEEGELVRSFMPKAEMGYDVINDFTDYREVNGLKVSYKSETTVLPMGMKISTVIDTVEVNTEVNVNLFSENIEKTEIPFPENKTEIEIPFRMIIGGIYIEVVISNSEKVFFLLDSGAASTVIDLSLAEKLKLKKLGEIPIGGGGGHKKGYRVDVPSIKLQDLDLGEQKIVAMDLDELRRITGSPIMGVIGYDFLKDYPIEIKYSENKVVVFNPMNFKYKGKGISLPIIQSNNLIFIEASLDDINGKFLIDTGNNSSLLMNQNFHKNYIEKYKKLPVNYPTGIIGIGGQEGSLVLTRFKYLKIGKYSIDKPLGLISKQGSESIITASSDFVGNIGYGILSRFDILFDYKYNLIYLEPNSSFSRPFIASLTGIMLDFTKGSDLKIKTIVKLSSAEKAGLKEGDIIISINDQLINSRNEFQQELEKYKSGDEITITVKREGKEEKIKIKLKDIL
ncbi:MAG: aspartyl protease family protein [Candidatus Coatesbacteria bacterium]|nr:aspartyl protease family protein [Candidatus Coatesbacteria bacterium]